MGMIYDRIAAKMRLARHQMCEPVRPSGQCMQSLDGHWPRNKVTGPVFVTPRQVASVLPRHPIAQTRQGGSATCQLSP